MSVGFQQDLDRVVETDPVTVSICSGYNPPEFVIDAAKGALDKLEYNQYAPTKVVSCADCARIQTPLLTLSQGNPRLKKAIASAYSPLFGREINPDTEIAITTGANEGLEVHQPSLEI